MLRTSGVIVTRDMSSEDLLDSTPCLSSTREDLSLSYGDLASSTDAERRSGGRSLYSRTPDHDINCYADVAETRKTHLLKTLIEAEAAANSAAMQLISFKDAMEEEFADSSQSANDKRRITRQRCLLLEKLEVFKQINKSVRSQMKQLQEAEAGRLEKNKQIDVLLKKISQAENDNFHLRRDLKNTEKSLAELMDLRSKEQENKHSAIQMKRSVEVIGAHLQGQLLNKETDNNRLTAQLRTVERTLVQQKMEVDDLREVIANLSAKAAQEKEDLRKATRAQKQRAERFEAAVDKCYARLREKDTELSNARAESDSWRSQREQQMEEREHLEAQVELLKSQVADLTARLQREKEEFTAANEVVLQKVERLNVENGNFNLDNATLKASISELEQQLAHSVAALTEERARSQETKSQAEQLQTQVAELQAEVDDLRIKYESVLRETKNQRRGKDAEIEEMGNQGKKMKSSMEMKDSIQRANSQLQERVDSHQKQMEEVQQENRELVQRLADQEESLHYSNRQLDQRSTECQVLSRQLETALSDIRQQVTKVKEKAACREEALQAKVIELETERSRRETELKLLKRSKLSAEKQFEVRLRDLQLSLDQSESHKQSIQNYVDFLKNSYAAMFEEGLPLLGYGSTNIYK